MQNRYVGDVGDFAKLGLLRFLAAHTQFSPLAVIWFLTADETHNNDGRHTTYFRDAELCACDSALSVTLESLVKGNKRTVGALQSQRLLPETTVYFATEVGEPSPDRTDIAAASRKDRAAWSGAALSYSSEARLIFVDPDNGIAPPGLSVRRKGSQKYVYLSEIDLFLSRGQSVVVYHHMNRTASVEVQLAKLVERLRSELQCRTGIWPLLFRRGSPRTFFLMSNDRSSPNIVAEFLGSSWGDYFTLGPLAGFDR